MLQRRLPAEWEKQYGIQLTFPHLETEWAEDLHLIEPCLIQIAKEISYKEKVLILCINPEYIKSLLQGVKANLDNIKLFEYKANDIWARDHAGITIFEDKKPFILDFAFNGWGLKYKANLDNQITRELKKGNIFNTSIQTIDFILEGGSIESDGLGTILTTSKCLLSPNRNPSQSKTEIENNLKNFFGAKKVLWLNHGYMAGDDTDCHIDTLARFCNENTICYMQCTNSQDEHFEELQLMEAELRKFTTLSGEPYNLIPLPFISKPLFNEDGIKLPATYANFLIINSAVLVPLYNDSKDEELLQIFQNIFPNHEIIGINSISLILQRGSLHCATMQFPAEVIW